MSDEKPKRKRNNLLRLDTQVKHKAAQQLAQLREWWSLWSPEDREKFKQSIRKLREAEFPPLPNFQLQLQIFEGTDGDSPFITPPLAAIAQAIEHWERGECYTPVSSLGILEG